MSQPLPAAEILRQLAIPVDDVPYEALEAAREASEEVTPHLLRRLEEILAGLRAGERAPGLELPCLLFLLAELRETRALATVVQLCELPSAAFDEILGDLLVDGLDRILPSISGGDAAPLVQLADGCGLDGRVRGAAIAGILSLVGVGSASREAALELLRTLLQRGRRGEDAEPGSGFWGDVFLAAVDLHPGELRDELELARQADLFDPELVDWAEIDGALADGKEATLEGLEEKYPMAGDAIEELEAFLGEERLDLDDEERLDPDEAEGFCEDCGHDHSHVHDHADWGHHHHEHHDDDAPVEPIVRDAPKVGRNDPCPCGSGKKHKKCCGK